MFQHSCRSTPEDRRGFLRKVGGFGLSLAGLAGGGCAERDPVLPPTPPAGAAVETVAKVVEVRSERGANGDGRVDAEVVAHLLDAALCELFEVRNAASAWESLFQETDLVGLKLNCLAGARLSSRPELAQAIARGLGGAGVAENAVLAWDRTDEELLRAGYELNTGDRGMRCFGTDHESAGTDRELVMNGKVGGFLSAILTRQTTAMINVPVLKDHGIVGVSGALKNNYGCIHNPNKYHTNCGDPHAADLNALPQIRDKQRLVVCDATTLQYQGGPAFKAQWAVPYGGLLVATDPVALDTVCHLIIEKWRKDNKLPSLEEVERPAKHIATAGSPEYALGTAQLSKINFLSKTI